MGWSEAVRLTRILVSDTSSQVGAAVRGWDYPIDRADESVRGLIDLFAKAHFKRPDPYPRPWDQKPTQHGNASLTVEQFRALRDSVAEKN